MAMGHPPIYKTPQALQAKIDEYFQGGYRKTKIKIGDELVEVPDITISDLVIFLGFCDRRSFYDYENREGFSYTIKKARSFIEREYESLLRHHNCTGAIFALKNFGWIDNQHIDLKANVDSNVKLDISGMDNTKLLDVIKQQTVNK